MQRAHQRIARELSMLKGDLPDGYLSCFTQQSDNFSVIVAQLEGPIESPYADGRFELHLAIHERYPIEPPNVRFHTPIYHPNVDESGRICLDLLKMPPKGSWRPAIHLSALLTSIRLLLAHPNPDDPLMADEYRRNRPLFQDKARQWTLKYAKNHVVECTAEPEVTIVEDTIKSQAKENAISSAKVEHEAPSLSSSPRPSKSAKLDTVSMGPLLGPKKQLLVSSKDTSENLGSTGGLLLSSSQTRKPMGRMSLSTKRGH